MGGAGPTTAGVLIGRWTSGFVLALVAAAVAAALVGGDHRLCHRRDVTCLDMTLG